MSRFKKLIDNALVSSGSYLKDRVCTFGSVYEKTIDGVDCFGPAPTRFVDVQTDFLSAGGFSLGGPSQATNNNRLFFLSTVTTGVVLVGLYSRDPITLKHTVVGRIRVLLPNSPATTHTITGIRVLDSGSTGWKVFIATRSTGTNALRNGGVILVNKVDLSDFNMSITPITFAAAISDNAKGVYFLQDPTKLGQLHEMGTVPFAGVIGLGSYTPTDELLALTGTSTSMRADSFFMSTAPTVTPLACTVAHGTATVFTSNAHGLSANDALLITAANPTGFSLSDTVTQVAYFVRNPTANTFELSATFGGTSILGSGSVTPTVLRAFGITSTAYNPARRSGVITTAFSGTALLLDSIKVVTPTDSVNAGLPCVFFPTGTTFYNFRLSDLTSGAISLPSAAGINNTGTGIDYVAPATICATYSELLGKVIYTSAAFSFYMKSWLNSNISHAFGSQLARFLENNGEPSAYLRGFVTSGIDMNNGVLYVTITTTGQRGFLVADAKADASFGLSYLTTPVRYIGLSKASFVTSLEKDFNLTDASYIEIRSASSYADPIFDNDSSGWVVVDSLDDLSTMTLGQYIQVKLTWTVASSFLSGNPAQLSEVIVAYERLDEMSEKWFGMADGTTSTTPSYVVYRQVELYDVAPATLYHRGYDDSDNLVEAINTTANISQVAHSLNDGVTWLAGVGPNQLGKRLRFERTLPPTVVVKCSLREA
jgi:hypothetical protein